MPRRMYAEKASLAIGFPARSENAPARTQFPERE